MAEQIDLPFDLHIQAASLLKRHTEADGWDAVNMKCTLVPRDDFDIKLMSWDVMAQHGVMYLNDHGHHKYIVGAVDDAQVGKGKVDLDVYIDLQLESAQEAYKMLLEQQPLAVNVPGKVQRDDQGNITKAVSGRIVLLTEDHEKFGQVLYDADPQVRAKMAAAAEAETAAKWAEELGTEEPSAP